MVCLPAAARLVCVAFARGFVQGGCVVVRMMWVRKLSSNTGGNLGGLCSHSGAEHSVWTESRRSHCQVSSLFGWELYWMEFNVSIFPALMLFLVSTFAMLHIDSTNDNHQNMKK